MLNIILIGNHVGEFADFENYLDTQFGSVKLAFYSGRDDIFDHIYQDSPDIIMLQYSYENNTGSDFCHTLKNKSISRFIPVILITEKQTSTNERIKGMLAGADAFIAKPIDKAELIAIVNVMLRIKNAEDKLRKSNEELKDEIKRASNELRKKEKRYSDFINYTAVENYLDFGGIRLEDDILITDKGHRVLGTPIPKTIAEVEQTMSE